MLRELHYYANVELVLERPSGDRKLFLTLGQIASKRS